MSKVRVSVADGWAKGPKGLVFTDLPGLRILMTILWLVNVLIPS